MLKIGTFVPVLLDYERLQMHKALSIEARPQSQQAEPPLPLCPRSKYLLLLSCSARKSVHEEPVAAIDRYDGPLFQVLRRHLRQSPQSVCCLEIWILSARFGLLPASHSVPAYDDRLCASQVPSLRLKVHEQWESNREARGAGPGSGRITRGFVALGAPYRATLPDAPPFNDGTPLVWAQGAPGTRALTLKHWLSNIVNPLERISAELVEPVSPVLSGSSPSRIVFAGRECSIGPLDWERALLPELPPAPSLCWCVRVRGRALPVKWLASQLSGVPRGHFSTDQARRFLQKLGLHPEIGG